MSNPNIKILQWMHGSLEYFPWSELINRRYCERHGYNYVLRRDKPREDRHVIWHKPVMILDELRDCDYMLYLDADAVFYGHEFTIEEELIPALQDKLIPHGSRHRRRITSLESCTAERRGDSDEKQ